MAQSLQSQEEPDAPVPAAQVRVTPQELASALARLESRHEAGRQHEAGTVALGEAVQELGLPVTPEELWREVQSDRAQAQPAPLRSKQTRAARLSGVAAATLLAVMGMFALSQTRSVPPTPEPAIVLAPATPQAAPISLPQGLVVRDTGNRMVLLSEVADNRPVLCNLTATDQTAAFAPFASDSQHWTLVKHGGRVYLRGWIADMSPAALRSSPVEIHPLRQYVVSAGLHPVPVTLPVDGFMSTPGLTNDDMISATGVKPDAHYSEKW